MVIDNLNGLVASNGLALELAGLVVAAVLLVTLVTLEVRRAGSVTESVTEPGTGQPTSSRILSRRGGRAMIAAMWILCVLLFLPRVLGLLA
jgi:hypothetical protein